MNAVPSNSDSPSVSRITAISLSLRCFAWSLIGLVPLIGLPFAVAAMVQSRKVSKARNLDWNPADRYLSAARRVGPLGFLTSALFLCVVCVAIPAILRDMGDCSFGST